MLVRVRELGQQFRRVSPQESSRNLSGESDCRTRLPNNPSGNEGNRQTTKAINHDWRFEDIRYQWDAADYERYSSSQQQWARDAIRTLKLAGDERVLDIGCGDGKVTAELAARWHRQL